MPSTKPRIVIRTEKETMNEFKKLADKESRSVSNLGEILIKKYIEENKTSNEIHDNKNVLINQHKIENVNMQ